MTQFFKGDAQELKFFGVVEPALNSISTDLDSFFDSAFQSFPLGDLLIDLDKAPLAKTIARDIFRSSFFEIFDQFYLAGTGEAYLAVFMAIFGDDVDVTFTVPADGALNIDILASGIEFEPWVTETGEGVVDETDDGISFESVKGFTTEYDLNLMLREMIPDGVASTISLSLLSEGELLTEGGEVLLTEDGEPLLEE